MTNYRHIWAVALVSAGVYLNTLGNGFMWDDKLLLNDNGQVVAADLPAAGTAAPAPERGRLRPLRSLSLAADGFFWGGSPAGYHFGNILLHCAAGAALYLLAAALIGSPQGALAAALLFAVHPAHVESVAWIKNRSDILCALFGMLSLLSLLRYSATGLRRYAAGFFAALALALLSKETAVAVPALAAAAAYLLLEGKERRRALGLAVLSGAAAAVWLVSKEFWWRPELFARSGVVLDANLQMRMVLYTLGEYSGILLWPFGLNAERGFGLDVSLAGASGAWLALMAAWGLWTWLKGDGKAKFFYLWIPLTLLPVSNIVFLEGRPIAEQRLYLPSIGLALSAGLLFSRPLRPAFHRARLYVFAALLLTLGGAAFARNFVWHDEAVFWADVLKKSPEHYRANYSMGIIRQKAGDYRAAAGYYETAGRAADIADIFYRLAFCYDQAGDYARALANYEKALKLMDKPFPDIYNNIGIVQEKAGNAGQAAEFYRKALAVSPGYEPARKNLERVWKKP